MEVKQCDKYSIQHLLIFLFSCFTKKQQQIYSTFKEKGSVGKQKDTHRKEKQYIC